jgi:hypothetical protein
MTGTEHRPDGDLLSAEAEAATVPQGFAASVTTSGAGWELTLPSTPLRLGPGAELAISAQASPAGYSFTANGEASPAQLARITHALPQLGDDTGLVGTAPATDADTIQPVSLSCSRSWSGGQSCAAAQQPARPAKRPSAQRPPAKRHTPG